MTAQDRGKTRGLLWGDLPVDGPDLVCRSNQCHTSASLCASCTRGFRCVTASNQRKPEALEGLRLGWPTPTAGVLRSPRPQVDSAILPLPSFPQVWPSRLTSGGWEQVLPFCKNLKCYYCWFKVLQFSYKRSTWPQNTKYFLSSVRITY